MKDLLQLVNGHLKPLGYRKSGNAFYLHNVDTIAVIEFQKSRFSESFYVNMGVWIAELCPNRIKNPKGYDCHVFKRLDFPENISPNQAVNLDILNAKLNIAALLGYLEVEVSLSLQELANFSFFSEKFDRLVCQTGIVIQKVTRNELREFLLRKESD